MKEYHGTSLVAQWLALHTRSPGAPGLIPVGELDPTCPS